MRQFYRSRPFHIQQALVRLRFAVSELRLIIKLTKIEAIKFKRGDKVTTGNTL